MLHDTELLVIEKMILEMESLEKGVAQVNDQIHWVDELTSQKEQEYRNVKEQHAKDIARLTKNARKSRAKGKALVGAGIADDLAPQAPEASISARATELARLVSDDPDSASELLEARRSRLLALLSEVDKVSSACAVAPQDDREKLLATADARLRPQMAELDLHV
jgi:type VI protein secretion system component VasK